MKDITDEIRKLKAVIVKHENRIRALEAAAKERDEAELNNVTNTLNQLNANKSETAQPPSSEHSNLAPDEV